MNARNPTPMMTAVTTATRNTPKCVRLLRGSKARRWRPNDPQNTPIPCIVSATRASVNAQDFPRLLAGFGPGGGGAEPSPHGANGLRHGAGGT